MMKKKLLFIIILFSSPVFAGITFNKTRVIFFEGTTTQGASVMNINDYPSFVQMWVDTGDVKNFEQDVNAPFVVIPPIFNLKPKEIRSLKIIYNGKTLPENKESLYWLNIYEVPATRTDFSPKDYLLMSMKMQIKLIYRPQALKAAANNAAENVSCEIVSAPAYKLYCNNKGEYYVSYSSIQVSLNNHVYHAVADLDLMIAPFSDSQFKLEAIPNAIPESQGQGIFNIIDDRGDIQTVKKALLPPGTENSN